MNRLGPFLGMLLVLVVLLPACKKASTIVERERQEKATIRKVSQEIGSWDKNALTKDNTTLEGDPARLTVKEFYKGILTKKGVLVDIRTPKEFAQAHIPDARLINFYSSDFEDQFSKLDREEPVFIYCRTGVRSAKAMKKLTNMGFQVYNLAEGFQEWNKYGLPIFGQVDHKGGEEGC